MSFAFNLSAGSSDLLDFGTLDVASAKSKKSRKEKGGEKDKDTYDDKSSIHDEGKRKRMSPADALDDLLSTCRPASSKKAKTSQLSKKRNAVRAIDTANSQRVWYGVFDKEEEAALSILRSCEYRAEASLVSPQREVARRRVLRRIHAALEEACGDFLDGRTMQSLQLHTKCTLRNGDAAFERWLLRAMGVSGAGAALPSSSTGQFARQAIEADADLAGHLESAGATRQQSSSVIEAFRGQVDDILLSFDGLHDSLPGFSVVARQAAGTSSKRSKKSKKIVRLSHPKY